MQDRTKFIGGSDIPIILGLSSYKTPYQLYLEKLGINPSEIEDTPLQYWGKQIEPLIRNEFIKRHNVEVLHDTDYPQVIHHQYDYLRGNLDGFIPAYNSVFEAKCANSFMSKEWGTEGTDELPLPYLLQVAFYCALTNADKAHVVTLIGGYDYREYTYTRTPELESKIIQAAVEFWENLQFTIEPRLQDIEDIKLKYNFSTPQKPIEATTKILEACGLLTVIKEQMKELKQKENEYKKDIMEFMQDAELLTCDGNVIASWSMSKRGTRTFLLKG